MDLFCAIFEGEFDTGVEAVGQVHKLQEFTLCTCPDAEDVINKTQPSDYE